MAFRQIFRYSFNMYSLHVANMQPMHLGTLCILFCYVAIRLKSSVPYAFKHLQTLSQF